MQGEYKSNSFFSHRNVVKKDKGKKDNKSIDFFLQRLLKFKVLFAWWMLLGDAEMVTNALFFSAVSSLLHLSGGLLRSVIAHRPLHCGTTSKAQMLHKNLI